MSAKWSKVEEDFLIEHYKDGDKEFICDNICRSWDTIRVKARKLGLSRENSWSQSEINLLLEYYPNYITDYLVENNILNRSRGSIISMAGKLGIKKSLAFKSKTAIENLKNINNLGENNPNWVDRIVVNCAECNAEIYIINSLFKKKKHGTFCSNKCLTEWRRKFNNGKNNPNWNNGQAWSDSMRLRASERAIKRLVDGDFSYALTKPQKIVNDMLLRLNILYVNEHRIGNYLIDNYLSDWNLMIEVQGNFYHCNPCMNLKNTRKDKIIEKDKNKNRYVKKVSGVNILYLWEEDLLNRYDMCFNLIKDYVTNRGVLKNYHSYNFNEDLTLVANVKNIGY